jgi:hypothetical protein
VSVTLRTISFLRFRLKCLIRCAIFKSCESMFRCIFSVSAICTTTSYLSFLLECLTSSPIFKNCELMSWFVFTV